MGWRDVLRRPWRQYKRSEPWQTLEHASAPQALAAEELSGDDAVSPGRRPDPDEVIHAEMAVMAAWAAERAREEELDNHRVGMMAPQHRHEYRRMRWEAINAAKISGMSPQRIEQEYRALCFAQWEQRNAHRIARMSPAERQESFRSEEMLTHYRAGLPARDNEERDAFREWRQLDADVANGYQEEVEIPERLWDAYDQSNGPLSREEFFAQYFDELSEERIANESAASSSTDHRSVPGANVANSTEPSFEGNSTAGELSPEFPDADASPGVAKSLPGVADARSGLEEGPMMASARVPHGRDGAKTEPPSLIPPLSPGSSDQMRPGVVEGLTRPSPRV